MAVLVALAREPDDWRHGYDLGHEVGLKAGTLYPILMRLSDRGLVEASWEVDPPTGRPRRHLYRIRRAGRQLVEEHASSQSASRRVPRVAGQPTRPRSAGAW
jgi:PadR family transcriptional regulator, regulatory protein PadR